MDRQFIAPDESCCIEVKYICTGKPLDADMEGELEFAAKDEGSFIGGSFNKPYRVILFNFSKRTSAERFEKYVLQHFPEAQTNITFDKDDYQ